jgi:multisubunit Na+/H+ antiporter MnhB subunit
MRSGWLLRRLVGSAALVEIFALALWAFALGERRLVWPFLAVAALGGLAGAAILLLTLGDLLFHSRRDERLVPVRVFDVVLGSALVLLAALQLRDAIGVLPAG